MNGNHTVARCESVTLATLQTVFAALAQHRVVLEQMLSRTGMVLAVVECPEQADIGAITQATLRCFRRAVPAAVPGILFLSGGQSAHISSQRMNAICHAGGVSWKESSSFGRVKQRNCKSIVSFY